MNSELEKEKMLLYRDAAILCVGVIVAMVIVWLTLNIPSDEDRLIHKQCYDICKTLFKEEWQGEDLKFGERADLLVDLKDCMVKCRKEIPIENSL